MNLFVSKFINKIDKKGRISLPSIFRGALPKDHKNEIILSKSLRNNFIDGLSVERVNEIAKRIYKNYYYNKKKIFEVIEVHFLNIILTKNKK